MAPDANTVGKKNEQPQAPMLPSLRAQCVCLVGVAVTLSRTGTFSSPLIDGLGDHVFPSKSLNMAPGTFYLLVCVELVVLALALRMATRFPRHAAHASTWEALQTWLELAGDVLLIPVRLCLPGEVPLVGYQRTPLMTAIIADCPSLKYFKHVSMLRNAYLAFTALLCRDFLFSMRFRQAVRRELLHASDGGIVALDWWEEPPDAVDAQRILFIGSTLTGDALVTTTRDICQFYSSRGWCCVVFVKRGCGLSMPNDQPCAEDRGGAVAAPWCLSGFADLELAIDHIARMKPGVPICGLGLSTGGGQLRNYVNTMGKRSKLKAAVIVDAAPTWVQGLQDLDRRVPLIAKGLAGAMLVTYRQCHVHSRKNGTNGVAASTVQPPTSAELGKGVGHLSGGMIEFVQDYMAPAHGFDSSRDGGRSYMQWCQPKETKCCVVPTLEHLCVNDTIISPENIWALQRLYQESPYVATLTTRHGTHMVRWEGWRLECWLAKSSCEFLESSLRHLSCIAS
jgi:predicted alpha/beta-fold hydrolase